MTPALFALTLLIAEPTCPIPLHAAIAQAQRAGAYASHQVLAGEQAALAVAVYNSMPPPSNNEWTYAVIVDHVDGSGVILVGHAGNVCRAAPLPSQQYQALKRGLFGISV